MCHLWSCHSGEAQQVLVKAEQPAIYKPLKSGERCMDIAGGNMADGSNVLLWDCHNGDNQQWRYEPLTGLIHSKKDPGYCLDNRGMAYDGGEVTIWRCTDSDNLRFDWYGNTPAQSTQQRYRSHCHKPGKWCRYSSSHV